MKISKRDIVPQSNVCRRLRYEEENSVGIRPRDFHVTTWALAPIF